MVGVLHNVRGDTLTIDIDHAVREQACLEWRMEIDRCKEPVSGTLRIIRVRLQAMTQRFRMFAHVEQISPSDLSRLSTWALSQEAARHRREDSLFHTASPSWSGSQQPSDSTARSALAQLSQRRRMRRGCAQGGSSQDNVSDQSGSRRKSGRRALRGVLRQSMARKRRRAQRAEVTAGGLPAWAQEQTRTASQHQPDPEVTVVPHTLPLRIQVRYQDEGLYALEYQQNISRYALFLPLKLRFEGGTMLTVSISPPGRAPVMCSAEVQVQMAAGVGVALLLSRAQIASLMPSG